jgi:amino-acid N-acetyltransferase
MDKRAEYLRLLKEADLPTADLDRVPDENMIIVTGNGGAMAAAACIQLSLPGAAALLRSVVVRPAHRGRGLGRQVVQRAERLARSRGATRLYLLTETAGGYFERLGYTSTPRETLPAGVAALPEAAVLCPDTATCMLKSLEERYQRDGGIIGRSITYTAEGGKPGVEPELHGGAS